MIPVNKRIELLIAKYKGMGAVTEELFIEELQDLLKGSDGTIEEFEVFTKRGEKTFKVEARSADEALASIAKAAGYVAKLPPPMKPPRPCSKDCPGWGVFEGNVPLNADDPDHPEGLHGLHIERCDACWDDVENAPSDDEYANHPDCIDALIKAHEEMNEELDACKSTST